MPDHEQEQNVAKIQVEVLTDTISILATSQEFLSQVSAALSRSRQAQECSIRVIHGSLDAKLFHFASQLHRMLAQIATPLQWFSDAGAIPISLFLYSMKTSP